MGAVAASLETIMSARWWNTCGLLLALAGVLILFRYGMPYRVRTDGASYFIREEIDHSERAKDRRYAFFGYVGLVLIVLGTAFQIVGAWLS